MCVSVQKRVKKGVITFDSTLMQTYVKHSSHVVKAIACKRVSRIMQKQPFERSV